MAEYKVNELNQKLKAKEAEEQLKNLNDQGEDKPLALDDAKRVKVLSPSRLVMKRFLKNKLAILGSAILIFMFLMCFLAPLFYPYGQTQKFYTHDILNLSYATSGELKSFSTIALNGELNKSDELVMRVDSVISLLDAEMLESGEYKSNNVSYPVEKSSDGTYSVTVGNDKYTIRAVNEKEFVVRMKDAFYTFLKLDDRVIKVTYSGTLVNEKVATVMKLGNNVTVTPSEGFELSDSLRDEMIKAADSGADFQLDGVAYLVKKENKNETGIYTETVGGEVKDLFIASKMSFDLVDVSLSVPDGFKAAALLAAFGNDPDSDGNSFEYDKKTYSFEVLEGERIRIMNDDGSECCFISIFSTRPDGFGDLEIEFKEKVAEVLNRMIEKDLKTDSFEFEVPQLDSETGDYKDKDGNLNLKNETITVTRQPNGEYKINYDMNKRLIAIYQSPSLKHILGTDADGYDVFARILYGGRVSLLVGFVVVILETFIGVILGGISGYFGGWVDTFMMRLVDIFFCVPTMPILIILAAMFDAMRIPPYERLFWLMVLLGVLGWSGIARLVRGQILSLREQEFMIAAEATGLKVSRRIFKHLIPNVMPQLIVSMTMGLGGVILTESTLSFLGLGVKHPLATWGNMLTFAKSMEALRLYAYIWIPVGALICLTVIAFNFVGDGLRDAFDPKMKR